MAPSLWRWMNLGGSSAEAFVPEAYGGSQGHPGQAEQRVLGRGHGHVSQERETDWCVLKTLYSRQGILK